MRSYQYSYPMRKFLILTVFISFISQGILFSQITIPKVFASDMVLPRNKPIPITGKGQPNETIEVTIKDHIHNVKADRKGEFTVTLDPMTYGGPFTLSFKGTETLVLENILIGDLWLCAGQSNMQYTLKMIGYKEADTLRMKFPKLRFANVSPIGDYLPQKEVSEIHWKEGTIENARDFSASGFFFGRHLVENQDVPIGLISSNLGATAIETWMSIDALKQFPQFDEVTDDIIKTNKDFATINRELEKFRKKWDKKHYLKGIGLEKIWYADDYDDSDWESCEIPVFWEYLGFEDHDGSFWFRKTFDLEASQLKQDFTLKLNQIDDYDITWVNGHKVGETFGVSNYRNYVLPKEILREKNNTLTVRVFDIGGTGGIYSSSFWGNPILNGTWKYKKGRAIDVTKFPIPKVVNGSLFSYPSLLYNGGIAPLHKLPIKGIIWYQGEFNEHRGVEYEQLLKGMITDWRDKWDNSDMPFFIVQLANFREEDKMPVDSKWAEVRNSQMKLADAMHNVDIMTAIDIGDAIDIHPRNKIDVGKRLGLLGMHYSYDARLKKGPSYASHSIEGDKVIIDMNLYGSKLRSLDKHGYLRGFAIAGVDEKFQWAKAYISKDNQVTVYSETLKDPKYVRYAWSDNPGKLDLVNEDNLPAFPFRTDNFKLSTADAKFWLNPHNF